MQRTVEAIMPRGNEKSLADRMQYIQPFHVMALLARARELEQEGKTVIHMEVGEPDFETPAPIVQAGMDALRGGKTHYTPAVGLRELREAISHDYQVRFGMEVNPARIVVTPGASGALQLVLSILINPGDQVLMADPGYPCNRNFVHLLDGVPTGIPVTEDSAYQLNLSLVEAAWTDATRAVMLASPSNPTGTLIPSASMKEMIEYVLGRSAHVVVDEIYQGLVYQGCSSTALALSDQVFVINSFSKYFGMTGWRVGWVVAPEEYVPALDKLAQNIFLAAPTVAQHAALAAFLPETMDILEQRKAQFQQRRDYLVPALRELGFDVPVVPEGAFYIYANCSRLTPDSFQFCRDLLEQAGVAATPGLDFGENHPEKFIRFAYTTNLDNLREGMRRLARFIGGE